MICYDEDFILRQIEVGPMKNFTYFIGDKTTKEIGIVDPGWDIHEICSKLDKEQLKLKAVLLTHGHYDHAQGLDELLSIYDVAAYISKYELDALKPKHKNIVEIVDGHIIKIGNVDIKCIHTPGHTPGSQCFKADNILFTGDTLFINGCGRCDLPGSDPKQMYHSLYDVIMKLPNTTLIYPGHKYSKLNYVDLGSQKQTNPYLTCKNLDEFLSTRM